VVSKITGTVASDPENIHGDFTVTIEKVTK